MASTVVPSTENFSNKELFEYWQERVVFRNTDLISNPDFVGTTTLRHDCTNYDELWKSPTVLQLPRLEQDRMVAVIKYVCTSRVLQRRSNLLRSQITEIEDSYKQLEAERSNLERLIHRFKQALFGKEQAAEALQAKIKTLTTENEALKVEAETSKAYTELLEKFETLQKAFNKESARRKQLGRNNQSLGGRVAHSKRYKRERDEARAILAEQVEQIEQLIQLNNDLASENKKLNTQLDLQRTSAAS